VPADGTAIVGVDDEWCAAAADRMQQAGKRLLRVSVQRALPDGLYLEGETIMQAAGGSARAVARIGNIGSLRGVHNAQNAACAAGAALALGLSLDAIQQGLESFPGLAHRMEQVGRKGRVLFVNDSKATNADSAAQALACFSDIFWIAGGKPKTGGIASLARFFPRIRKAYLIGEAAAGFAAELEGGYPTSPRARSIGRWSLPLTMPKRAGSISRWCCCRRPAPRSTSIAISKSAATSSAIWSGRSRHDPDVIKLIRRLS
jgi:UDP-N-acetylmuramoylalanine--D-glutamate ligase